MKIAVYCVLALASFWPGRSQAPRVIPVDDLFRHWVRSYEEESGGAAVQVFRPAGSRAFPPSRFRMAFKFARKGGCEWFFLSPDDSHRFKPCTWSIAGSDSTLLRITADGTATTYRITELSRTVLRLTPLRPKPGQ